MKIVEARILRPKRTLLGLMCIQHAQPKALRRRERSRLRSASDASELVGSMGVTDATAKPTKNTL
jgi:hypothetical protein